MQESVGQLRYKCYCGNHLEYC